MCCKHEAASFQSGVCFQRFVGQRVDFNLSALRVCFLLSASHKRGPSWCAYTGPAHAYYACACFCRHYLFTHLGVTTHRMSSSNADLANLTLHSCAMRCCRSMFAHIYMICPALNHSQWWYQWSSEHKAFSAVLHAPLTVKRAATLTHQAK